MFLNNSNFAQYLGWQKQTLAKYANTEPILSKLATALQDTHCILTVGPGGYGKSDILFDLFNTMCPGDFEILDCSSKTPLTVLTNNLTGDISSILKPNFSRWRKPDGSWVKAIILEEYFDLSISTIMDFKTILENRRYIDPDTKEVIEIGVEVFIAATNKTTDDIMVGVEESDRMSMQAAVDRFRRIINWKWDDYGTSAWDNFFKLFNLTAEHKQLFTETFGRLGRKEIEISPRMAKNLANAFSINNNMITSLEDNINTLAGLSPELKQLLLSELRKTQNIFTNREQIEKLEKVVKTKINDINYSKASAEAKVYRLNLLGNGLNEFNSLSIASDDKLQSMIAKMQNELETHTQTIQERTISELQTMYNSEAEAIRSILSKFV